MNQIEILFHENKVCQLTYAAQYRLENVKLKR